MKVALLQLSDIHIRSEKDFVVKNQEAFCRSSKPLINACTKLVVIITGDIAFKGSKEEYDVAYNWLKLCESFWKREASFLNSVEYIVVPGNHDCDFERSDEIRELIIETCYKQDEIPSEKYVSSCLSIQENFWDFYSKLRGEALSPNISWTHEVQLRQDFSLIFNCYNSALLSQLNETPGKLTIPRDKFIVREATTTQNVVISLYHHNTGWLNPNTPRNNKKEFEHHVLETSNIAMCGHEHSEQSRKISGLASHREFMYLESPAFQSDETSKYGITLLDTDSAAFTLHQFEYSPSDELYKSSAPLAILKLQSKQSGMLLAPEWEEKLDSITIPLKHNKIGTLRLSDVFVFPDLDPYDIGRSYQYIDSEDLLNNKIAERILFLEGENQAGKTSLLRMLYSLWHQQGVYPIMVLGKDLKHVNINKQLEDSYKTQYLHKKNSYEKYKQLDRSRKIVLIDDFNESILNNEHKSRLLSQLLHNFEKVVITSNLQMDVRSIVIDLNNEELKRFKLLSLGYSKRNALIEKWIRLGEDATALDEQRCLDQIKYAYDNVSTLLGQQLIPSYPVFILSLLQGLNQMLDQFDISQTSYAFCYNSLIMASLINSGMKKENIPGVLSFLSEFAYYLYQNHSERKYFDKDEFQKFCVTYQEQYYTSYSTGTLLEKLCKADIIRSEDSYSYSFAYKYIFYYLIAKKLSLLINDDNADGLVQKLCESLHKEREANILIFLAFLNGTGKQLDDVLFASMLPFEDQKPITLKHDDPLFKGINNIVDNIKSKVILQDIDPFKNRETSLRESDDLQRKLDTDPQQAYFTEEDFEENSPLREMNSTFKIIQILGQIAKNQKDTLKKGELLKLIEESYNVCFRSISFFGSLVEDAKEEIAEHFIRDYKDKYQVSESQIRARVHKLLYMLLFQQCLAAFSNLSRAVGISNCEELFKQVAASLKTPAAKIVSFSINTYYNSLKIADLEELVSEYRNNPVVMEIIKARVLNYLYNNLTNYSLRQKIGELCNLKLINNSPILKAPHRSNK